MERRQPKPSRCRSDPKDRPLRAQARNIPLVQAQHHEAAIEALVAAIQAGQGHSLEEWIPQSPWTKELARGRRSSCRSSPLRLSSARERGRPGTFAKGYTGENVGSDRGHSGRWRTRETSAPRNLSSRTRRRPKNGRHGPTISSRRDARSLTTRPLRVTTTAPWRWPQRSACVRSSLIANSRRAGRSGHGLLP